MAIELVADKDTRRQLPPVMNAPARLTNYGLAHGIALYNRRANCGQFGDIQLIAPPLTITEQEIDDLVERLGRSLLDFERDLEREGALG
jgi:adenosylmethionine-8-amino-7-oxononanoate aminotransferase